jgi:hypothetical protein
VFFFLAVAEKGDDGRKRRRSQRKRWQGVMEEPSHRRPWKKR